MEPPHPFEQSFVEVMRALGLLHFGVEFAASEALEDFAEVLVDSRQGAVLVRYNPKMCAKRVDAELAAAHEACHVLIADLRYAAEELRVSEAAEWEEEKLVRRLEPLLQKAVFSAKVITE